MWRRALRPRPLSLRRQLLRERERESEMRDSVVEQRRGAHLCHRDACAHVDIRSIRRFARRRVRGGCRVFAPGRGHREVRHMATPHSGAPGRAVGPGPCVVCVDWAAGGSLLQPLMYLAQCDALHPALESTKHMIRGAWGKRPVSNSGVSHAPVRARRPSAQG